MNNKYIILIVLLLCLFIGTMYYTNYKIYNKDYIKLFNNKTETYAEINIERYQNDIKKDDNMYNIILNGSFEQGSDIKNKIGGNSYNKIVTYKNPGQSSYVLKQSSNVDYYEISLELVHGKTYQLSFWFKQTNSWKINSDKIINMKITRDKNDDKLISTNGSIIEKKDIDNDEWNKIAYIFTAPDDTTGKSLLYLTYNSNKTSIKNAYRYFTDIRISQHLKNSIGFPIVDGLVSYISACNKSSHSNFSKISKDLSDYGNDFNWDTVAKLNKNMYFETIERKLTGPSPDKMGIKNSNNFSIIIHAKSNGNKEDKYYSVIEMLGNTKYGIQLTLPSKNGNIIITAGDKTFTTTDTLISTNDFILTLIYREETNVNEIEIWIDGTKIFKDVTEKIFFTDSNIIINNNKDWDARLYNMLFYKKALSESDINILLKYLKLYCGEYMSKNQTDINNILFDDGFNEIYDATNLANIDLKNEYNELGSGSDNMTNYFLLKNDNSSKRKPENGRLSNKTDSIKYFHNKYDNYSKYDTNLSKKYKTKKDKSLNKYNNQIYNPYSEYTNKEYRKYMNSVNYHKCPIVFKQNGNYMVYIKDNSIYSKKLKINGKKSYGPNMDMAKKIYKINFPNCKIPDILEEDNIPVNYDKCPFIVHKNNPCFENSCKNINWNDKTFSATNNKCKKSISYYCEMNNETDPSCMCWKNENKNSVECKKFRRNIENPAEFGCNVDSFNIEEHSDINKYILKNNIPCYGCTLDTPIKDDNENIILNDITQGTKERSWNNYTK